MGLVVKAYRDVCADLIMLLEDIEESLDEISRTADVSENSQEINETLVEKSWLERHFDFSLKN